MAFCWWMWIWLLMLSCWAMVWSWRMVGGWVSHRVALWAWREIASKLSTPLPANRSRVCWAARSCPSQLNRRSRTLSGVGRSPSALIKGIFLPRRSPPMMRTWLLCLGLCFGVGFMGIVGRLGFCGDGEFVFRLPMCGDEDAWAMPMIRQAKL